MANNMPGFASDIAADPLGQRRYNIPNLPFKDMRRQGPVDRLDESVGEAAGHRNDHRWVAVVRLLSSSRI